MIAIASGPSMFVTLLTQQCWNAVARQPACPRRPARTAVFCLFLGLIGPPTTGVPIDRTPAPWRVAPPWSVRTVPAMAVRSGAWRGRSSRWRHVRSWAGGTSGIIVRRAALCSLIGMCGSCDDPLHLSRARACACRVRGGDRRALASSRAESGRTQYRPLALQCLPMT